MFLASSEASGHTCVSHHKESSFSRALAVLSLVGCKSLYVRLVELKVFEGSVGDWASILLYEVASICDLHHLITATDDAL